MKSLVIVHSFHHRNTQKIAEVMAKTLDAELKTPRNTDVQELKNYDLIGLGSGIYHDQHHSSLLKLLESLQPVKYIQAFIFSTTGAPSFFFDKGYMDDYIEKAHSTLKDKLENKGFEIVGDFMCPGWNTNKFLKIFGGLNKGRPNDTDFRQAEEFVLKI